MVFDLTASEDELFQKAKSYDSEGDAENAIALMKRLIQGNPTSVVYNGYLGTIYFNLRRYHLSRDHFKLATNVAPHSGKASLGYFQSLWGLGFIKAALNEIERYCSHRYLKDYEEIVGVLLASELAMEAKYNKILCRIDGKIKRMVESN